ncbi:MAG: PAS domain S-box protein [Eubacteriales bacterium]|nr:PAS domain S-box protein [Eubacteriales bacterium]MDD6721333.1 ATP-binding protein [Clostridiales bacterium]HZK45022.1 ATP-binding protein [Clostridia bacterium]
MTKKIFKAIALVAGIMLIACLLIIVDCLYEYFCSVQENELKDMLDVASKAVSSDGSSFLTRLKSNRFRLTWIAADGSVIYDTQTGELENHMERAEVKEAMQNGEGESRRYSSTLMEKTIYYAKRLDDGTVLRISTSSATAGKLLLGMLRPIVIVLIAALVLSLIFADRLAKRIVEPLNALDLDRPLENDAYEELSPLLNRINRQHMQIARQLEDLNKKKDEFEQITESMQEGLVLLDQKGTILSINKAARSLFLANEECIGKDFITIERSYGVISAIQQAVRSGHAEERMEQGGRIYQLDITRIESAAKPVGAVILSFDITEQENAEQNRREFTANVSHELKTPLQGIIGSAELIENGMVKPEDMPRFVGHIRTEAQRLVTLIADIIRLSQLDEGHELPMEGVDMLCVASDAAAQLKAAAEAKHISMSIEGEACTVYGARSLLYEVAYNLIDNAIKYNRENGMVDIKVSRENKKVKLTVSDTGIGIAPEHQQRIFERFYRVDKSHSKASGGTGLGLSIVKHAVQYHHGEIKLKSELNKGSEITVALPEMEQ